MIWPIVRLGDVARVQGGRTPKGLDRYLADNPRSDRDIPFYKVGDMKAGSTLRDARTRLSASDMTQLKLEMAPTGSVVFPKAGGAIATNKKCAIEVPGPVDLNCMVVTPGPQLEPRFLQLWFESFNLSSIADGSVLPQISKKKVGGLDIPRPPLDEQGRIVDILENHHSRLDAAESYLAAAQVRESVLRNQLLSVALAEVEAANTPLASVLTDRLTNGRSVPTQDGGFPVLRLTALRDGRIDLTARKGGAWTASDASRFLVKWGDFLISRGNGSLRLVGSGGLVTDEPDAVAFPDTLIRAQPDRTKLNPEYLALVWNSPLVRRQIEALAKTTAGIYKVNQKDLGSVLVPVPSLDAQAQIVAEVQKYRDALDILAVERTRATQRSTTLRRSLLVAAFSGRMTRAGSDVSTVEEMVTA